MKETFCYDKSSLNFYIKIGNAFGTVWSIVENVCVLKPSRTR